MTPSPSDSRPGSAASARDELITGSMVKGHLEALRLKLGASAMDAVLGRLDEPLRDELRLVTPLSWVRIATVERLYELISADLGTTVEALHIEIGSAVIGRTVTTLWRALLHLASDDILLKRSPILFKRAYQQGRMELVRSAQGVADLQVLDWPSMSEFALRKLRIGIESTLRAAGRKQVRGTSRRTPTGAALRFEWAV